VCTSAGGLAPPSAGVGLRHSSARGCAGAEQSGPSWEHHGCGRGLGLEPAPSARGALRGAARRIYPWRSVADNKSQVLP
jgi:hypothetical protein